MRTVEALHRRALEAAGETGASRVTALTVRVGALSHLSAPHLRRHFDRLSRGTLLAGARLIVSVSDDRASHGAQDVELVSMEVE